MTRELRSGCVAVSLAECLVLWFCVSLLCDRHRPSSVHPYRVGVPVVGRTVFRLPINQSIVVAHGRLYVSNAPPYEMREEVRSGSRLVKQALRRIHALTLPTLEPVPVVDDILKAMAPLSRRIAGSTARGLSRRAIFAHGDLLCYVRSDNTVCSIRMP